MGIIEKLFEGRLVPDAWCGKSSAVYRSAQDIPQIASIAVSTWRAPTAHWTSIP